MNLLFLSMISISNAIMLFSFNIFEVIDFLFNMQINLIT